MNLFDALRIVPASLSWSHGSERRLVRRVHLDFAPCIARRVEEGLYAAVTSPGQSGHVQRDEDDLSMLQWDVKLASSPSLTR